MQKITPFLWFNNNAEEAVKFYTSVFKKSKIGRIAYQTEQSAKNSNAEAGSVLMIEFEINGQTFNALNGGPLFKFNESVSFVVRCKDQKEVDYYWDALLKDGGEESQCGWLKDKFGLSWQITPEALLKYVGGKDREKAERAMAAMMEMGKIDVAKIEAAVKGK
jgi:predicted 3-demethylubiquinone-9 3-methyltransferase (glyoxalase superfamily)